MLKEKTYPYTKFPESVIRQCQDLVDQALEGRENSEKRYTTLAVTINDEKWRHDRVEEFFADYRKTLSHYSIMYDANFRDSQGYSYYKIEIADFGGLTAIVSIRAPERAFIERIFSILEGNIESARLPMPILEVVEPPKPIIFIGHGRNQAWRDLKDHLHEQHGYIVEAYETGARSGHTIRDILEDMVGRSSFALIVLTGDDKTIDHGSRARQNVIHEAGLFQGKLGFNRAILLVEDGVELFSNIDGVQQIRFRAGAIRETFGDVLATLRREFGSR